MKPTTATKNCNKPHKMFHTFSAILVFVLPMFYFSSCLLFFILLFPFISFTFYLFFILLSRLFYIYYLSFPAFSARSLTKLLEIFIFSDILCGWNYLNSFFQFPSFLAFFEYLAYIWFVSDLEKCPSSQLKVFAQL